MYQRSHGLLGGFVRNQWSYYKLLRAGKPAQGKSQERSNQLEALGFKWSIIATHQSWDDRMEQLNEYKKEHGHVNVPPRHGSLGMFLSYQRRNYKLLLAGKLANSMTQERAKKLEALGFKWSSASTRSAETTKEK